MICLWASPEKIWERVRNQSHRPLLHDPDPKKKIQELLAARGPAYKKADVLLNTARGPGAEAAAYALGAAATLALAVLIALSGVSFVIGLLRRRA